MEERFLNTAKYKKSGTIISWMGIILILLSTISLIYYYNLREKKTEVIIAKNQILEDSLKTLNSLMVYDEDKIESLAYPIGLTPSSRINYNIVIRLKDSLLITKISSVDYFFNHHTFHPKLKTSSDPSNGFQVSYKGWGALENVPIYLHYIDGSKIDTINYKMLEKIRLGFPNLYQSKISIK